MQFARKIFWKTKFLLDEALKRLVWQANKLEDRTERSPNTWVQAGGKRVRYVLSNIAELISEFPYLDVVRIEGDNRSLVYVGHMWASVRYVLDALFPDGYEETSLGRVGMWQLSRQSQQWLRDYDMVMCCVIEMFPWPLRARYRFTNPINVNHILDIEGRTLVDITAGGHNKNLRKLVNRARKVGYNVWVSRSLEDLRIFYDRMYVPLMQKRHGELGVLASYEHCLDVLNAGGYLLFLGLDDRELLCDLMLEKNGTLQGLYVGVLDGDDSLMADGTIFFASYINTIEQGISNGVSRVNFDNTNAWVTDGLYAYKQRWGTHPELSRSIHHQYVFLSDTMSPMWAEHLNTMGFITHQDGQYLRICIDDTTQPESKYEDARKSGLDGVLIVTANGQTIISDQTD